MCAWVTSRTRRSGRRAIDWCSKDDEKPFLQGWAIVENTTEQDWNDVNLTLVSGRPISFIMDLYQPLYAQRPVVQPELYASLRPQMYDQDLAAANEEFRKSAESKDAAPADRLARSRAGRMAGGAFGAARGLAAPAAPAAGDDLQLGVRVDAEKLAELNLAQGGQSLAQGGDVGELFQYTIATPVTLPRQQSAMLPIVNGSVEGTKVSIYNQSVHAKHPLNGLKLKNTTKLHLMQGPVTVFDGGAYAGDAKIEDLQPDTERLISYALDLDTEVAPETQGSSRAADHREDRQRHAARHAKAHAREQLHREELRRQDQDRAGGVCPRPQLETDRAQRPGREDAEPVSLPGRGQAGHAGQARRCRRR